MEISWQGKTIEVDSVDFLERRESWNEYQVTDGKVLKIKLVCTRIFRAREEKDAEGNALYIIQSTNVIAPPE